MKKKIFSMLTRPIPTWIRPSWLNLGLWQTMGHTKLVKSGIMVRYTMAHSMF